MLDSTVELLGALCLIALPLMISFCIVGSIVAALRAVNGGGVTLSMRIEGNHHSSRQAQKLEKVVQGRT